MQTKEFKKQSKLSTSHRNDFYITLKSENDTQLVHINKNETSLFSYVNETNIFAGVSKKLHSFTLFPLKYNVVVYFETKDSKYGIINLPGELIDLSTPSWHDFKTYPSELNFNTDFKKYINIHGFRILNMNCYSRIGFVKDLIKIIIKEVEFPWDDEKYGKKSHEINIFYFYKYFR
jgi:hypothetical protein